MPTFLMQACISEQAEFVHSLLQRPRLTAQLVHIIAGFLLGFKGQRYDYEMLHQECPIG